MKDYKELTKKIDTVIDAYTDELFAHNCDLADHPEISGEEYETSKKAVNLLKSHGFQAEYPFAGMDTAFRAIAGPSNHKHKVALLTEYDALPGLGHACGHCSMLAGIAMQDLQDELDTDVHIIGTPAEETNGGKITIADQGLFDDYDMALMIHMYDQSIVDVKALALYAAFFTFHGKAAHASANPWDGVNALNAAQLMLHAVDMMRQHVKPDVRMHAVIHDGGTVPGIVPERAQLEIYVRSLDRIYLEELIKKVDNCAEAGALATGCTVEKYLRDPVFFNMKRNETGIRTLEEVYDEVGVPLDGDKDDIFGSTDCGNVSWICPAFQPVLKLSPRGVPVHSKEFEALVRTDKAKECLVQGARILSHEIAKVFSDPEKIASLKADFKAE